MIVFQNLSRIIIPSKREYIDNIISKIVSEINNLYLKIVEYESGGNLDILGNLGFGLSLSIDEALKNAIEHGNGNDERKLVQMEYYIDSQKIQINVRDEGKGFNYKELINPTPGAEKGRGLMLIKNFMDEVTWNETGSEIIMIKLKKTPVRTGGTA
ncbi:MAG: ATP-binding protein [Candidatus Wallbacteria bacterium]|nr:ATP-binding protein [Candidatus Wallbacteria bacterium]